MADFLNEQQYKANRKLPQWLAHLRKLLSIPARFAFGWKFRVRALRWMGVQIENCYVGRDCLFDEEVPELITVESGVVISSRVVIAAHDSSRHIVGPVHICKKAFIGIGAILLPGVTIGEGAVVAAGSVVSKSVDPHTMVAGVPARPIKHL